MTLTATTAVVARRPGTATRAQRNSAELGTPPSIEVAREALSAARRTRAEYLIALTEGLIDISDLLAFAVTEDGAPLRRISLRQLLLSQPGWGERRTARVLSALSDRLGTAERPKDMTIAWLIDPRSGGRRYLAWLDVRQAKSSAPWPGFPFATRKGDR